MMKNQSETRMVLERTFAILKPETVERRLVGETIKRIEEAGFKILALKLVWASREQAERLYEVHFGKPFYHELIKHITSGPIVPMVLEAENAVEKLRKLIGATDPARAEPGTIRRDLGLSITKNAIHAADSPESFQREYRVFFSPEEILSY